MDATLDSAVQNLFQGGRSPQQQLLIAVSSDDPDVRRDAVAAVSKSKKYNEEWAIKGLIAIALLENNSQTRCVAIRALGRTSDARAVDAVLRILNHRDHPPQEVWPPDGLCRWDATAALADFAARDLIPDGQRDLALQTLIGRLQLDSERHARIAAAGGLGYFLERPALDALIAGLRDTDFAVAHQCECSLVQLTGVTHGADALAWEQWVAQHEGELFANAGYVPEELRPPYDNRWEKMSYETKSFFRWLWPGSDDD
jgi:HEAT repeat protein